MANHRILDWYKPRPENTSCYQSEYQPRVIDRSPERLSRIRLRSSYSYPARASTSKLLKFVRTRNLLIRAIAVPRAALSDIGYMRARIIDTISNKVICHSFEACEDLMPFICKDICDLQSWATPALSQ